MMDRLLAILSREPVRIYLYTVLTAVVSLLLASGVLTATMIPHLMALFTAVLAVPAVEAARSKVTPVQKISDVPEVISQDDYPETDP